MMLMEFREQVNGSLGDQPLENSYRGFFVLRRYPVDIAPFGRGVEANRCNWATSTRRQCRPPLDKNETCP
jgi:hypothetical protein